MLILGGHKLVEGGEHKHHEHPRRQGCVQDELQEVLQVPRPYTVVHPGAMMIHLENV
jgi:hypothetical protein